jgi:hypothetical protein
MVSKSQLPAKFTKFFERRSPSSLHNSQCYNRSYLSIFKGHKNFGSIAVSGVLWISKSTIKIVLICFMLCYSYNDQLQLIFQQQLYSAFGKSLCTYKSCWKWCPRASIQARIRLILFANTFCRSFCEMLLINVVIALFNLFSLCVS